MRNPRESQSAGGESALATKLLWSLAAMALLNGCLLPQDDVLDALPSKKNLPPLILDTGRRPGQQTARIPVGPNCGLPAFEIVVDDDSPNLADKWFIDPVDAHTSGFLGFQNAEVGSRRKLEAPFELRNAVHDLPARDLPRVVEVVITDGRFGPTEALTILSTEVGNDEKGKEVQQEVFRVSYSWFITVDPAPCP